MLKLKDKSISAYKGDYRPVELFENAKKLHGFNSMGIAEGQRSFKNTYNDYLTVYGKSGHIKGVNLMPPPENVSIESEDSKCVVTLKDDGRFDFSGMMVTGMLLSRIKLRAGTYTASGCEYIELWWEENGGFLSLPATFTINQDTEISAYFLYTGTTEIVLSNQYIQIEEGETASEYSQYIYPASPDNMQPVISSSGSIRCEGGNLIPTDFEDIASWEDIITSEGATRKIKHLDLLPGKYVLSFNYKPLTTYMYLYLQRIDSAGNSLTIGHLLMNESVTNNLTFEVKKGYSYRFWSWRFIENISLFSDIQIRRAAAPDTFYKVEPIINVEVPMLRGIEVTAMDDYNYSETAIHGEKYYISDCLKGNVLTKRIGMKVLTGNENIVKIEGTSEEINTFAIDMSAIFSVDKNFGIALCNYFEILNPESSENEGAILGKNDKKLYLNLNKAKFSDLNSLSEWLKAQYNAGNPVKLYYVLEEPVTKLIDAEKALKSYPKFTTVIVKNQNTKMPFGVSKMIKVQI